VNDLREDRYTTEEAERMAKINWLIMQPDARALIFRNYEPPGDRISFNQAMDRLLREVIWLWESGESNASFIHERISVAINDIKNHKIAIISQFIESGRLDSFMREYEERMRNLSPEKTKEVLAEIERKMDAENAARAAAEKEGKGAEG
jgi:hypothetical protein